MPDRKLILPKYASNNCVEEGSGKKFAWRLSLREVAMIVRAYGLFWRRDWIWWGTVGKGSKGHLHGQGAKGGKRGIVDFRDQVGIYVLYQDYNLVYCGYAGILADTKEKTDKVQNLFDRLRQHTKDEISDRWDRFSWYGLKGANQTGPADNLTTIPDQVRTDRNSILKQLEAILITAAEPPLNRQGGRWCDAKRYRQVRDSRLGKTQEDMLKEILNKVE